MSSQVQGGGNTGPWVGSLLRHAWQRVRDRIYHGVVGAGYRDLTRAHVGLFRFESLEGWRPSELADHMSITKQSVNDLLRDLERLGYLMLRADPEDGRARLVRLTARGRRLDAIVRAEAKAAERELADALGASRFNGLRRCLLDLLPPDQSSGDSAVLESAPEPKRRRSRAPDRQQRRTLTAH
jgi:DNA-binding MarR family transcriptional regulator